MDYSMYFLLIFLLLDNVKILTDATLANWEQETFLHKYVEFIVSNKAVKQGHARHRDSDVSEDLPEDQEVDILEILTVPKVYDFYKEIYKNLSQYDHYKTEVDFWFGFLIKVGIRVHIEVPPKEYASPNLFVLFSHEK